MEPHIIVSSTVQTYEDAEKIVESINVFFPDWKTDKIPKFSVFPTKSKTTIISGRCKSLEYLLKQIRIQRILDTALDIMCLNLEADSTEFDISRQAALAGKVSFVLNKICTRWKI